MAGFYRYETKKGVEYASFMIAKRVDKTKTNEALYLGRVIDKENNIFRNRKYGTFSHSRENGCVPLPYETEIGIYDFGNAYVLKNVLEECGFLALLRKVFDVKFDTIASLVFYRILQGGANSGALDWFDSSWTRDMFPRAGLQSQRLSEFIRDLGDEQLSQRFFHEYLAYAKCSNAVLIDSTGLPNAIDTSLTALNCHGGQVSNEIRFILVHDKEKNIPVYYRCVAGNIVDVSTLNSTLTELEAYNVKIDYALLDAGYCSEANIKELYASNIRFVTRLGKGRNLYKALRDKALPELVAQKHLVKYRDRLIYIKRIDDVDLYGNPGYAYVARDFQRYNSEFEKYMREVSDDKTVEEQESEAADLGLFILISSEKFDTRDILPMYYKRQGIEQIFDLSKNCAEILPLRVHNETVLRGHLLLSFIAIAGYTLADKHLAGSKCSLDAALSVLRNLKVKQFADVAVIQEPQKKVKEFAKMFGVTFPRTIPCDNK